MVTKKNCVFIVIMVKYNAFESEQGHCLMMNNFAESLACEKKG